MCPMKLRPVGPTAQTTVGRSAQRLLFPATSLQKLKNGRFYLTDGAAVKLDDSIDYYAFRKYCYNVSNDYIIIHDGVELYSKIMECYKRWKNEKGSR